MEPLEKDGTKTDEHPGRYITPTVVTLHTHRNQSTFTIRLRTQSLFTHNQTSVLWKHPTIFFGFDLMGDGDRKRAGRPVTCASLSMEMDEKEKKKKKKNKVRVYLLSE